MIRSRVGGEMGIRGRKGGGGGVGNGEGEANGHGGGGGAGTGTEVETYRRTPDGNGERNEVSSGEGNGYEANGNGNGNEGGVGEGGREDKKRKKPLNSGRRRVKHGKDFDGRRKRCRIERVGPVSANLDNLESNKEAGGGARGSLGSSKNCTSRESVSPLSRLIRGFRNKFH